jgi:hypothetical protein
LSLVSRLKNAFLSLFGFEKYEQTTSRHGDQNQDAPSETAQEESVTMAERFKRAFSREGVKVHFVGAWYVFKWTH